MFGGGGGGGGVEGGEKGGRNKTSGLGWSYGYGRLTTPLSLTAM